jgi:excisionase family DNA binding protein
MGRTTAAAASIELPERLLTPDDLARLLGVTKGTVYGWARSGRLPPGRLHGKFRRWTPGEIRRYLEARGR